jgi:hypothetical protein
MAGGDAPLDALAERVRAFVARRLGLELRRVALTSRLLDDLGVDGAAAAELMAAFAATFGVDLAGFQHARHFGAQGRNPLRRLLPAAWARRPRIPVTVGDLVEAAAAGRWLKPSPDEASSRWQ